jgi:hypothetical protein
MLAAITSEIADIVRPGARNASRRESQKLFSLLRGTEGSNPSLSSGESTANLIARLVAVAAIEAFTFLGTQLQLLLGFLLKVRPETLYDIARPDL